jgi:hypothetical protein
MAYVFRGKVAIPGDQMDAYLDTLGQFERAKAPLRTHSHSVCHLASPLGPRDAHAPPPARR